jgi:hypothetical protein
MTENSSTPSNQTVSKSCLQYTSQPPTVVIQQETNLNMESIGSPNILYDDKCRTTDIDTETPWTRQNKDCITDRVTRKELNVTHTNNCGDCLFDSALRGKLVHETILFKDDLRRSSRRTANTYSSRYSTTFEDLLLSIHILRKDVSAFLNMKRNTFYTQGLTTKDNLILAAREEAMQLQNQQEDPTKEQKDLQTACLEDNETTIFDNFLTLLKENGTWGNEMVAGAIAEILKCNIYIYHQADKRHQDTTYLLSFRHNPIDATYDIKLLYCEYEAPSVFQDIHNCKKRKNYDHKDRTSTDICLNHYILFEFN